MAQSDTTKHIHIVAGQHARVHKDIDFVRGMKKEASVVHPTHVLLAPFKRFVSRRGIFSIKARCNTIGEETETSV